MNVDDLVLPGLVLTLSFIAAAAARVAIGAAETRARARTKALVEEALASARGGRPLDAARAESDASSPPADAGD